MNKNVIPFDAYEVHGCRDFGGFVEQVTDDKAQFWSLYGHIPGEGLECIGDFSSRAAAEEICQRITGGSQMLRVLQEAQLKDWVHNAAITDDIEALRTICLGYAKWWNEQALPVIALATGQGRVGEGMKAPCFHSRQPIQ